MFEMDTGDATDYAESSPATSSSSSSPHLGGSRHSPPHPRQQHSGGLLQQGDTGSVNHGAHHHQHQQQLQIQLQLQQGQLQQPESGWLNMEETRGLYQQLVANLSRQFDFLEHERLALLREQQLLEQKRHAFEEVKKQMSSVLQLQENRVKLNVGGVKFVTSLDTLLMHPDSMLGSMFSGKYRLEKDEKGYFFIDRDGTNFRYILNFLRTGTLLVPEDALIRKELQIEAEFYQIPSLTDLLAHPGNGGEARFSKELCHKNLVLDPTATVATVATKGTCRVLVDTASVHSGKSYWEIRLDKLQNPNCVAVGVSRTTSNLSTYVGSTKDGYSIIVMNRENLKKWNSPTCEEYGKGGIFREGDTVGLLLDFTGGERGTLSFYINRVSQGEAFRNLPPHLFPAVSLHSKGDQVSILPFAKLPDEMQDA